MNIAVNLLQVKTADGFDVMCDSVFLSFVDNGIASFDVYVLERQELQDQIFIIAEHCDPSQDAPDMIISCQSPPNPFSDLRTVIRTSGRKASEVEALITSLETSSVLADKDNLLLNKICSTYLYANYGKKHNPKPEIVHQLAFSIVNQFPVTRSPCGEGHEVWYDINTKCGRLYRFVGRKRRAQGVKRSYTKTTAL